MMELLSLMRFTRLNAQRPGLCIFLSLEDCSPIYAAVVRPVEEDSWRFRRVVMHDTHPLLSYVPGMPTTECTFWWWWCQSQNGWIPRTYRAEDGSIVSWHELKSENDDNMREWGVQATFTGKLIFVVLGTLVT